jgi:putative endonuclease
VAGGDPRRRTGADGEVAVAAWYVERGYEILDRNWRIRDGELDIVARRGSTIVFCEVKTRRSDRFGLPVEAVTARKQQRLRLLATRWLDTHDQRRSEIRFDVASVTPDERAGWVVVVLEYAF